ncbi:MAG TPA: cyclic nucleotide-binding domain-containing protein [Burkholderiales bacterium]|jgi:CRP-like cAMP-binding protein|nr:cyclic nucleotide-binding domain-containing protein [Burkholderiales bacterium]
MPDDLDFTGSLRLPAGAPPAAPVYVPAVARAFFESAGKEESLPAGTVLFAENEKASRLLLKRDKMYFLAEGVISLTAKGQPIGMLKAGEIFGEMAALSDSPRSATAVAKTICRVISLDDKGFAAALQKKPEFALMMLGTMILRLRGMIAKLSGVPSTAEVKESRVFDKALLATMINGLGDRAIVRYDKGKVIMVAGQTGALMYVVTEGRIAISIRGAVVERIGPGGIFGEMALVDQSPRAANAAAETDCALLAINRNVFLSLVKSEPAFGIALLSAMAERLRNTAAALN